MAKIEKLTCILILMFLSFSFNTFPQKVKKESHHFKSTRSPDQALGYVLYKPKNFKAGKAYPLLVYLHGSGSVGNNLEIVSQGGIPFLIEEGMDLPFIVMAPQLPSTYNNHWPPDLVNEFIVQITTNYTIDSNRIYLTGFSMGGTGVWDYACAYPTVIACAVPLSGWGNPQVLCKMKNIPTWVFHGSDDKIVSPKGSRNLTAKLKSCGGDVTLTELAGIDHEAWRNSYSYPGLIDWISSKNKADTIRRKTFRKVSDETKAYKLPKALYQITGLTCSPSNEFYGIAAKNSQPIVFNFDTLGHIKKMIRINNASNLSWQDLAYAENGYLYIADIGNDGWRRKFFQIYKVKNDDLATKELIDAEKIEFQLPDDVQMNFKSVFYMSGELFFFGETSSGENHLMKTADQSGKILIATDLGIVSNLRINSITSAVFDSKAKKLYVLNRDKIEEVELKSGIESLRNSPSVVIILPSQSRKEGIALLANGQLAFTDQNFLGTVDGNLYIMNHKGIKQSGH